MLHAEGWQYQNIQWNWFSFKLYWEKYLARKCQLSREKEISFERKNARTRKWWSKQYAWFLRTCICIFQKRNSCSCTNTLHTLAIAGKDSSTSIAHFKEFFKICDQVACFYEYSIVWTAGLKEISQMSDDPVLKLSCTIGTCWLLKGKACMNLKKIFQVVLISLSRNASVHGMHKLKV